MLRGVVLAAACVVTSVAGGAIAATPAPSGACADADAARAAARPTVESFPIVLPATPEPPRRPALGAPDAWSADLWLPVLLALLLSGAGWVSTRGVDAGWPRRIGWIAAALLAWLLAVNGHWSRWRLAQALEASQTATPAAIHDALVAAEAARSAWRLRPVVRRARAWLGRAPSPIDAIPIAAAREANAAAAIVAALGRGDADEAVERVDWFPAGASTKPRFAAVALAHRGHHRLIQAHYEAASADLRAARALHASDALEQGRCAADLHLAIDLGLRADRRVEDIATTLGARCAPPVAARVLLETLRARAAYLDPAGPTSDEVVGRLEAAWALAQTRDLAPTYLACELAATLEARGVAHLHGTRSDAAVRDLDRSLGLVPGRPGAEKVLAGALYALAVDQLKTPRVREAAQALMRARTLHEAPLARIDALLALVGLAAGVECLEADEPGAAVEYLEAALVAAPDEIRVSETLGDARLAFARNLLADERFDEATQQLEQIARSTTGARAEAVAQLATVTGASTRLSRLRAAPPWLSVPVFHGEVARDVTGDGVPDRYVYFAPGTSTVRMLADRPDDGGAPRRWVVVTDDGTPTRALDDTNGDGRVDQTVSLDGEGEPASARADVDGDGLPDVDVSFFGGAFPRESPLSGHIMLTVHDAVVDADMDFWSRPDVYVVVSKNGRTLMRTSVVEDSNYPVWGGGVAIDFRYGDSVSLEGYDEDLFNADEFIDSYRFGGLPTSGVYAFSDRKLAVRVSVRPSTLPEGYTTPSTVHDTASNVFRRHPERYPEVLDIVAGARRREAAAQVKATVLTFAASELLLARLLPLRAVRWARLRPLLQLGRTVFAGELATAFVGAAMDDPLGDRALTCARASAADAASQAIAEAVLRDREARHVLGAALQQAMSSNSVGATELLASSTWRAAVARVARGRKGLRALLMAGEFGACLVH